MDAPLGSEIAGGETHCNGGFHIALGCGWWRGAMGNVIAGFRGGAVLLGNDIAGGATHCCGGLQVVLGCRLRCVLWGNAIAGGQTHCNGGFQVALGC